MKTKTPSASLNAIPSKKRSKSNVLDAYIFHSGDPTSFVNLKNLLTFFIDLAATDISGDTDSRLFSQIDSCINHLKSYLYNNTFSSDKENLKTLNELLEECDIYQSTLKLLASATSSQKEELHARIIAKSTQIQWLGVCLLEGIKKNLPALKL